jgi:peptide/nickel transport system substrate-binding protein
VGELKLRKKVIGFFSVCIALMIAVVLAVPMGALTAVFGASAADEEQPTQLRIGFMQKVDSLNPYIGVSDAAYVFYGLVYDTLDVIDEDLNPTPSIATDIFAVPLSDPEMQVYGYPYGSVWQYNLTDKAYFADGEPVTAETVAWNINLNAGNHSDLWAFQPYSYYMSNATVVVDENDVPQNAIRIYYYDRASGNPQTASYAYLLSIYVLPRHKLEGTMEAADIGFKWTGVFENESVPIVGTGPFMATENIYQNWLDGDPITLVKNPNYFWGPEYNKFVQFDEIVLKFYDDTVAMTYALRNNQLDIAQFPPAPYYELKKDVENGDLKDIFTYDGPKVTQYWTEIGICQGDGGSNPSRTDPVIKQAIAQAVDKTYIKDQFYYGFADEGSTLIPPINEYWHYEVPEEDKWQYNLAAAEALLESNGYLDTDSDGVREATASSPAALNNLVPEGFPLEYEMLIRNEYPEEKEIAYWLRDQWATIGIKITVLPVDEPTLNTIVYSYNYDFMIWYWSADVDPNYQLYVQTTQAINGWNDNTWSNASYDENFTKAVTTMDREERKTYVDNCQKVNYEDASYVILAYVYQTYAWRTDTFEGWGDWDAHPGRSLDNFWSGNPLYFDLVPNPHQPIDVLIYVAIGIGVAAAVVAAVYFLRKRKGKEGDIRDEGSPLGD